MRDQLRVALVQTALEAFDAGKNCQQIEAMISSIEADIIVLPEMFNTGFSLEASRCAEATDGKSVQWLRHQAGGRNAVMVASLAVESGTQYFNRLYWTHPDGKESHYDKRHRFALGGENKHFSPGQSRRLCELDGWRFSPQICYDLRFPVWTRWQPDYDFHALLYVANWPTIRRHHWRALLRARAIENQCYVIAVNCIGKDANGVACSGDSMVIAPSGEILVDAEDKSGVFIAELDRVTLEGDRRDRPFLVDADRFRFK